MWEDGQAGVYKFEAETSVAWRHTSFIFELQRNISFLNFKQIYDFMLNLSFKLMLQ